MEIFGIYLPIDFYKKDGGYIVSVRFISSRVKLTDKTLQTDCPVKIS